MSLGNVDHDSKFVKNDENSRYQERSEWERKPYQITHDVFVGRIPGEWTSNKLREIFEPYGEIKSIDLRPGVESYQGYQFAFVRFPKEEMAKSAVDSLSCYPIENVNLQINLAQMRNRNKDYKERQGFSDLTHHSKKTFFEQKRPRNEYRRGQGRQHYAQNEQMDYGCSHGPLTSPSQKYERFRSHEISDQEREVLVTYVDQPLRFWAQNAKQAVAKSLSAISEEMQSYCPTGLKYNDNTYQKTKIYGALYSVDNLWYRCSIVKFLHSEKVSIRYIDYGNQEIVTKESLVELPPGLADTKPLALLYYLADCTFSTKPTSYDMTYALGIEQLKNLIMSKIVKVKYQSEGPNGSFNVIVKLSDSPFPTVNETMLDGGCINRVRQVSFDSATQPVWQNSPAKMEKSVAEKPLNEDRKKSFDTKSSNENKKSLEKEIEELKLTIKFQSESICNINKLYESMKQQNEYIISQFENSIKIQPIITSIAGLRKTRRLRLCHYDRISNIDLAIASVTAPSKKITMNRMKSFDQLTSSLQAHKLANEMIKVCENKENLKAIVEKRNSVKNRLMEDINSYVAEYKLLNIDERFQTLQETEKNIDILDHQYKGCGTLDEALQNYESLKGKLNKRNQESVYKKTDEMSRKLSQEFMKLGKFFDPANDMTLEDYGDFCIGSVVTKLSAAVASEVCYNEEEQNEEEIHILSSLIHCLKAELRKEVVVIEDLRSLNQECLKLQDDLKTFDEAPPDISKIIELRKNLKTIKSKLRHKLADKKDLEESDDTVENLKFLEVEKDLKNLRTQLHKLLVDETIFLDELSRVAFDRFPELAVEYPELGLQKFMSTNGLVKQGWELAYFSQDILVEKTPPGEINFVTEFNGEKCVLKEFNHEDINNLDVFEARATSFSRIKNENLIKCKAIFYDKTHRKAVVVFPFYDVTLVKWLENTRSDKEKRDVLLDIVKTLSDLHKQGITHGAVLMKDIYVDGYGRGILGEFSFLQDTEKRIASTVKFLQNSSIPSYDVTTVFDVLCLGEIFWQVFLGKDVLQMDLETLQKHCKNEALSSMLMYVLALNGGFVPSVDEILQHPFFNNEIYISKLHTTVSENETSFSKSKGSNLPEEDIPIPDEVSCHGETGSQAEIDIVIPQDNIPCDIVIPQDNIPCDIVTPQDNIPRDIVTPQDNIPRDIVTPQDNIPCDIVTPQDNIPCDIVIPQDNIPCDIVTPQDNIPRDIVIPQDNIPCDIVIPQDNIPRDIVIPQDNIPCDIVTPQDNIPRDIVTPQDDIPREVHTSNDIENSVAESCLVSGKNITTAENVVSTLSDDCEKKQEVEEALPEEYKSTVQPVEQ